MSEKSTLVIPVALRNALYVALPPISVAVIFVVGWATLTATLFKDAAFLLPSPSAVGAAFVTERADIVSATMITLREALSGYLSAIAIGITAAAIMSQSRLLERSFYPYAVLLQTVPVVAIAPLIVLWFGYGETSVIIISLIISMFPIINNTLLGLRSTSKTLVELFAMHRAPRFTSFIKLRLPAAIPNIIAGLRISAGLSVIGAIVGEFLIGSGSSTGGLGVQIIFAQGRMNTALLFALVISATLLGFILLMAVTLLGQVLLRNWHESEL
ncbi:MAG: ABC transporter permease subunit [Gammaproteobacteria bacterium]|nr:ABC transporter permease subunit [Gammaproteobacteria bacterium]